MLAQVLLSSVLMMPTQTADAQPAPAADAPVAPAAAEPVAVEGLISNADFIEGRRLYDSFEFEKASFRFRAATRAPLVDADRARALIWLGVSQGQAGDAIAARDSFSAALALDPGTTLPQDAPPTLEPVFMEARATTPAPEAAVDAPPAAAEPAPEGRSLSTLTIVGGAVAGAGALLAAGGAGLGLLAMSQASAAAEERFQDDAIAGYDAAQGTALLANGLFVVGGAAIAAGVVVLVVGPLVAE